MNKVDSSCSGKHIGLIVSKAKIKANIREFHNIILVADRNRQIITDATKRAKNDLSGDIKSQMKLEPVGTPDRLDKVIIFVCSRYVNDAIK